MRAPHGGYVAADIADPGGVDGQVKVDGWDEHRGCLVLVTEIHHRERASTDRTIMVTPVVKKAAEVFGIDDAANEEKVEVVAVHHGPQSGLVDEVWVTEERHLLHQPPPRGVKWSPALELPWGRMTNASGIEQHRASSAGRSPVQWQVRWRASASR